MVEQARDEVIIGCGADGERERDSRSLICSKALFVCSCSEANTRPQRVSHHTRVEAARSRGTVRLDACRFCVQTVVIGEEAGDSSSCCKTRVAGVGGERDRAGERSGRHAPRPSLELHALRLPFWHTHLVNEQHLQYNAAASRASTFTTRLSKTILRAEALGAYRIVSHARFRDELHLNIGLAVTSSRPASPAR